MRDPQRPDRPSSEDTLPPLNLSIPSTIARLKKEATAEREISDQLSNHSDRLEEKANEAQSKEEELDREANLLRDEISSLDQSRIPDLLSQINLAHNLLSTFSAQKEKNCKTNSFFVLSNQT